MSDLDARKQSILHAVIVEYVSGAEPVASEVLVQKYPLGVKSATVRNELAEMVELGYLEQPHTSAGRIPSDLGYRYYVDRLIVQRDLESRDREKVNQATEDGDALRTLLRDITGAISRLTHLMTIATTVRDPMVTVRSAVVSALGPKQALLVLVLSNGHIENRMVECPVGLTLEDVGLVNEHLNSILTGKTLRSLTRVKPAIEMRPAPEKLLSTLLSSVRSISKDLTRGILITEGEEFMFAQPELKRDSGAMVSLMAALEDLDLFQEAIQENVQQVTIGRENRMSSMHQFSLVRRSFYVGEHEAGIIALLGPTRMAYDRSIPIVHYAAKALSESLTKFLG